MAALAAPADVQIPEQPEIPAGPRKAAILLASLSEESIAAMLQKLSESEVRQVIRELSTLSSVSREERTAVLQEFVERASPQYALCAGGFERARSVLLSAFGPETGKHLVEDLTQSIHPEPAPIEVLRKADPDHLAKIIHAEHPQVIALVLCQLDTAPAAQLLEALPSALRPEIARRAAALDQIAPEVLERIAKSIVSRLSAASSSGLQSSGGVRTVAELLNRMDPSATTEILTSIAADDTNLDQSIRYLMFVFEDFLKLRPEALRTLLGRLDKKLLTVALKGSSPALKKHFTSLMSTRAAEMLNEDMQALGPVRIKDVEEAQQKIVAMAKQPQAEGLISLQSGGSEEFVE